MELIPDTHFMILGWDCIQTGGMMRFYLSSEILSEMGKEKQTQVKQSLVRNEQLQVLNEYLTY